MAGRPKDPTINEEISKETDQLSETTYLRDITTNQISENTGVSRATIYRYWKDKSSIIVDMFASRVHVFENDYEVMCDELYHFLTRVMNIYQTHLGRVVIEILTSYQKSKARGIFMKGYLDSNRKIPKTIISKHIDETDQDLFIDLIFPPTYFNILIKPNVLNETCIKKLLKVILGAYNAE